MDIEKGRDFTKAVAEQLIAENKKTFFASKLKFIQQHNGFRPGKLHLLIGQSGGGKSTMARTLLLDAAASLKKNKKILVWLSEETVKEFLTELAFSGVMDHASVLVERMDLYSEKDERNLNKSRLQIMEDMRDLYSQDCYDIFFYDNITTSKIYASLRPTEQDQTADWIKGIASKTNTATILMAHTGSSYSGSNGLIDHNHIRGSKHIVNLSEYIYILQSITIGSSRYTVLRVDKSRSHEAPEAFFSLGYDRVQKLYTRANSVNFVRFKELFTARNKL